LTIAALVINAAMLWGTTASAQSVEFLNAIKIAEEQREQGKLAKAFKTLEAIKPSNSAESVRKDKALLELVKAFLTNLQSEKAANVAHHIAHQPSRNRVVFIILEHQRNIARQNPEGVERMLGKAEKTAKLLTGQSRDEGYWIIALAYASAGQYDRSLESYQKIENVEYRDKKLAEVTSYHYVFRQRENQYLQGVCDLIQSPLRKTQALIGLANRYKKEGRIDVALKILTTIRPIVSETNRLSSPELEKPYGIVNATDDWFFGYSYGPWDNEFYIKDEALYELVKRFLETRQSDKAVIAARHISDRVSRNAVLLSILFSQCDAIRRNPEEFDLMIGKAEKTALLLTGRWRDEGYAFIAQRYYFAGKHDLAVATWKKVEDAECRDHSLISTFYIVANHSTQEQEKQLFDLTALLQTPSRKARALCQLAAFYRTQEAQKIDETDSKRKRFEALQEAKELLLSLPENAAMLLEIYQHYRDDKRDTEAVLTEEPNAAERFRLLRGTLHSWITPKDVMIDKLVAAAREIPEQNPRARLNAFWETARSADIHGGSPERAREILDETIAYAELIPKETRLNLKAEDQLWKVRKLRDELQKK